MFHKARYYYSYIKLYLYIYNAYGLQQHEGAVDDDDNKKPVWPITWAVGALLFGGVRYIHINRVYVVFHIIPKGAVETDVVKYI